MATRNSRRLLAGGAVSALAVVAGLGLAQARQTPAAAAAATACVQAGRLLADPASGKVETGKTLVVQDGKIARVEDGFVSEGCASVVDLRDSFVLPGLIDSHVHLTGESGPNQRIERFTKTRADLALDGA